MASSGNFGYELDLTKFSEEEKDEVKEQVAQYKELRELIQFGDFYRILSPFEGDHTAWMFVSEDKSEAFAAYFQVLAEPNAPLYRFKLKGLDPYAAYRLQGSERVYGGDELMYQGVSLPRLAGDFKSMLFVFQKVE